MKTHKDVSWDRLAAAWDAEAGDAGVMNQRITIDPVVYDVLGAVRGRRVLEIGCGNGYLSRALSRRGARMTAVDLSRRMIDFAVAHERRSPLGIRYLRLDAAKLKGLRAGSFDAVVGDMCLMDIRDLRGTVRETSRVLKPGGRFVFSICHPVFADFSQVWTWVKREGRQFFARGIPTYLVPTARVVWFPVFGMRDIYKVHYHRPVESYVRALAEAGLLIDDFREIRSGKPMVKAGPSDRDVELSRRLYRTKAEKRMKSQALREIPVYLVVGAAKRRRTSRVRGGRGQ